VETGLQPKSGAGISACQFADKDVCATMFSALP